MANRRYNTQIKPSRMKVMGGGMMNKPMGYDDGGKVKNTRGRSAIRPRGLAGPAASGQRKREGILKDSKLKKYNVSGSDLTIVFKDGDKVKKMGGGMMNKPMGYKSGTSVMARGCKLGRKKATKIT